MEDELGGFQKVANMKDVPDGSSITVQGIDIVDICLINLNGKIHAISNICTHKGAPLNEGYVKKEYVVCPWHYASFRISDGKNFWPGPRPLRCFEIKVIGESIYLRPIKKT